MLFSGKRSLAAGSVSAVLAALGVSAVCCAVPLMLFALGITGAWAATLSGLQPFAPWLTAAALLFMALAFRQLYLLPAVACADGEAQCATTTAAAPRRLRRMRLLFWLVALKVGVLLSFPLWGPRVFAL